MNAPLVSAARTSYPAAPRHGLNFAYGSNLDSRLMRARCGGERNVARLGRARLPGFVLAFEGYGHPGGASGVFATVRRTSRPGAYVEGIVFRVTPAGWADLDRCEGCPRLYTRETVRVELARPVGSRLPVYDAADAVTVETYLHAGGAYGLPSPGYVTGIALGYAREGFRDGHLLAAYLNATRLAGRPVYAAGRP